MKARPVNRFDAGLVAALAAVGAGLALASTALVVAAVPGLVYAAYAKLTAVPELDLTAERTAGVDSPLPGDEVDVTLEVRNEGDRTITDLRVFDGVPDGLTVVSGHPEAAVSLRPGERTSLTYSVAVRRGVFQFDPVRVDARSTSGAERRRTTIDVGTTIRCAPRFDDPPVRDETTRFPGTTATDEPGEGISFYATREYQPGDPMSRIDWNRLARTTELTTVQYRAERAATVVVVVDARAEATQAPVEHGSDGAELGGFLAERAIDALAGDGHRIAVAAIENAELYWVGPGTGRTHRARCRRAIGEVTDLDRHGGTAPAGGHAGDGSPEPPHDGDGTATAPRHADAGDSLSETVDARLSTGGDPVEKLRPRLPPAAQLLVTSPLLDRDPVDWVESFVAFGRPATVISPDPTESDRLGAEVAGVERRLRIDDVHAAGVPVVDWSPGEPVDVAVADTVRGWSL